MKKILTAVGAIIIAATFISFAKSNKKEETTVMLNKTYPKAKVSISDYKNLVNEVEKQREITLVSLNDFIKMSKEKNTIILDTRSDNRFNRKHLKGAIHLDFTDFSQESLRQLIPDTSTRILIYCNNNFDGDQIDFVSKVALPAKKLQKQTSINQQSIMLALNIPTYINLYGYGYTNIFELDELVNVNDLRIQFEGTAIK